MTSAFQYREGQLYCEGCALTEIHKQYGSPLYVYSATHLQEQYQTLLSAFGSFPIQICFAVKANSNQAILAEFAALGSGADVVSKGELRRALKAGIPANKIVFSGVGKTADEIREALNAGIYQLNVESFPEIDLIAKIAAELKITAAISFRVNPNIDAHTHDKISTGRKRDKFGINIDELFAAWDHAQSFPYINPVGLAVHIGSQLTDIEPFQKAFHRLKDVAKALLETGATLKRLDFGGGLGIQYQDEPSINLNDYAALIRDIAQELHCDATIEPGRFLVGNAGCLLSEVIHVKRSYEDTFLIIDGAMNDLLRPTLYEAEHKIIPVQPAKDFDQEKSYQIVGPICETGDRFSTNAPLPETMISGDLIAILSAGAYGAVMSSTYNTRPLISEVLIKGTQSALIRERQDLEILIGLDRLPDWK